jgi:hypothetical protein
MPDGKFHVKREVSLDIFGTNPDNRRMAKVVEITAEAVRSALLARATAFSEARNVSFSKIGKESIRDDRFLARVRAGENFTIDTYQRVIDWLDAAERQPAPASEAAA